MTTTDNKWVYIRVDNVQMCMFLLAAMTGVFLNANKIEIILNDSASQVLNFCDEKRAGFIYEELMAAPLHDVALPPKSYPTNPGPEYQETSIFIGETNY